MTEFYVIKIITVHNNKFDAYVGGIYTSKNKSDDCFYDIIEAYINLTDNEIALKYIELDDEILDSKDIAIKSETGFFRACIDVIPEESIRYYLLALDLDASDILETIKINQFDF